MTLRSIMARSWLMASLTGILLLSAFFPANTPPIVYDSRLTLTLVAEQPDIVTPIGIAVDRHNALFVLESHTHLRPASYSGPPTDVIKRMVDTNHDGLPDRISVFADGLQEGLNLAFSPAGDLYAVTSKAVWVLYDRDADGVCERREKVLELVAPASVYAHAALLGIAFSPDGWMYISRGNTGGQYWKLAGTDGSFAEGYGDGGNVVRARPDGSRVEEFATGFWNAMDLKVDLQGRLLLVDNDPDSRGPNRLVHVVRGGHYGYESLYGGSGLHPYLAWNGELPGTLPYAAALGEAPSGLLNLDEAALPADYAGQFLSSIWEESRLVRIALRPQGASVTGTAEVLVEGGDDFRPVAFATDSQGAIYFTDWGLRQYPNHGRGRIWRLAAKPGVAVNKPASKPVAKADESLTALSTATNPADFPRLQEALTSADPFRKHAAVVALANPVFRTPLISLLEHPNADLRLGGWLALRRASSGEVETLVRRGLSDPDMRIRRLLLQWIGQAGMMALKPDLNRALTGEVDGGLFETYLETVKHLDPDYQRAYRGRTALYAKSLKRSLPPQFIEQFVADDSRPGRVRALAVRFLPNPSGQEALLLRLLNPKHEPALRLEVIRTLADVSAEKTGSALLGIANDHKNPSTVRAEALLALARQPNGAEAELWSLLNDAHPDVRLEAARFLRTKVPGDVIYKRVAVRSDWPTQEAAFRQQVLLAKGGTQAVGRPKTLTDWNRVLAAGGNPERGRRVFYSVQASCSACHRVQGRGGDLGPDLDNVGRSKSREELIQSVLKPSSEISPEWQGWFIKLKNGEEIRGRQIDVGEKEIELYTQGEGFRTFPKKEVAGYGLVKHSLMPDGLEAQLTVEDLKDLLAFLNPNRSGSLTSRRP